jgi:putative hydrolase of the HAD superfamily
MSSDAVWGLCLDASGTLLRAAPGLPHGVDVFPDALRLLGACRARRLGHLHIRTAVVTNWGFRVHRMLESLGILDCFDVIVTADEVTHAKPHSEIFLEACSRMELLPQACVHVGDSLFDDALGAQAAGLHALWVHRRSELFMGLHERAMVQTLKQAPVANLEEAFRFLEHHLPLTLSTSQFLKKAPAHD